MILTQLSQGLSGIGFQVGGWVGTPYHYHVCDSPQLSGVEWELSKPSDLIINRGKSSQATTYSLSSASLRKQLTQSWPHHNCNAQLQCNRIQQLERVPNFYNSRQQKSWVKTIPHICHFFYTGKIFWKIKFTPKNANFSR